MKMLFYGYGYRDTKNWSCSGFSRFFRIQRDDGKWIYVKKEADANECVLRTVLLLVNNTNEDNLGLMRAAIRHQLASVGVK